MPSDRRFTFSYPSAHPYGHPPTAHRTHAPVAIAPFIASQGHRRRAADFCAQVQTDSLHPLQRRPATTATVALDLRLQATYKTKPISQRLANTYICAYTLDPPRQSAEVLVISRARPRRYLQAKNSIGQQLTNPFSSYLDRFQTPNPTWHICPSVENVESVEFRFHPGCPEAHLRQCSCTIRILTSIPKLRTPTKPVGGV